MLSLVIVPTLLLQSGPDSPIPSSLCGKSGSHIMPTPAPREAWLSGQWKTIVLIGPGVCPGVFILPGM